jgi:hypothetical protein
MIYIIVEGKTKEIIRVFSTYEKAKHFVEMRVDMKGLEIRGYQVDLE